MESLHAVIINGTTLYIKGTLSEHECEAVDAIARHFKNTEIEQTDIEAIYQSFIKAVKTSLNISFIQVPVKYVFRIK